MANRVVLSRHELERMRRSVTKPEITDHEAARIAKKELSDARVAKWPNTLEAQRRKKENWKLEKLAKEEEERREIDREEAELQKNLRIESIKRANRILYEQTDKMRGLRSGQRYSDVLADRQEQVEEKKIRSTWGAQHDAEYFKIMMEKLEQGKKKDEAEAVSRKEKSRYIAAMQQEQLAEVQAAHLEHLRQEKIEGELILEKAKQDIREDAEKAARRVMQAKMAVEEMQLANRNLKKLNLQLEREAAKEDAKILADLQKKEDLALRRKSLEAHRFKEKLAIRQRMIDRACDELSKQQQNEDARMKRQAQEARDKQDAEMAMRADKRRRQQEAIERSSQLQIRLKEEKKRLEEEQAAQLVSDYKAKGKEIEEAELKERMEVRRRNMELRAAHEAQATAKQQWRKAEREAQLRADAQTLAVTEEDEGRFKQIGEEILQKARAEGKNTKPIERALEAKEAELLAANIGLRG